MANNSKYYIIAGGLAAVIIILALVFLAGGTFGGDGDPEIVSEVRSSTSVVSESSSSSADSTSSSLAGSVGSSSTSTNSAPVATSQSYSVDVSYNSPAGPHDITANVTLNGTEITNASIEHDVSNPVSRGYLSSFEEGILEAVEGKDINEVDLDSVNGSSLTAGAFNKAMEQIADSL